MADRVVFDTSVLVCFAARPDAGYATWVAVRSGRLHLLLSRECLSEAEDVLARPRTREQFGYNQRQAEAFLRELRQQAHEFYEHVPQVFELVADPDDGKFVNLAIHARARYLVAYDRHLYGLADSGHPQHREVIDLNPRLEILQPLELAAKIRSKS